MNNLEFLQAMVLDLNKTNSNNDKLNTLKEYYTKNIIY